jgi:hypothetical protein
MIVLAVVTEDQQGFQQELRPTMIEQRLPSGTT